MIYLHSMPTRRKGQVEGQQETSRRQKYVHTDSLTTNAFRHLEEKLRPL